LKNSGKNKTHVAFSRSITEIQMDRYA